MHVVYSCACRANAGHGDFPLCWGDVDTVMVAMGLQAGNLLKPEMLLSMARDPVVFACANPVPEIDPEIGMAEMQRRVQQVCLVLSFSTRPVQQCGPRGTLCAQPAA
jgi:hypothetical protein